MNFLVKIHKNIAIRDRIRDRDESNQREDPNVRMPGVYNAESMWGEAKHQRAKTKYSKGTRSAKTKGRRIPI